MYTLFFSLLRVGVGAAHALPAVPTPRQWQALYAEARRQTLVGLTFAAIERLPAVQRPPREVLLPWFAAAEQIRARNRLLNRRCVQLLQRLRADGLRATVLKGQGVAQLYADPSLRMPGDIDVLVDAPRRALEAYILKHSAARPVIMLKEAVFPVFPDVTVEVHFAAALFRCPWHNRRFRHFVRAAHSDLYAHRVALPDGEGEISAPTARFNRVYLAVHIYRHLFGEGIGLRQVVDYYQLLLQPAPPAERAEAYATLCDLGMRRFAAALMWVLGEVLSLPQELMLCPPDAGEGRFLLNEIVTGGNFSRGDDAPQRRGGSLGRILRQWRANAVFLRRYPWEVLFAPLFALRQYAYRRVRGYR